jgi:hypothetical protein
MTSLGDKLVWTVNRVVAMGVARLPVPERLFVRDHHPPPVHSLAGMSEVQEPWTAFT